MPRARTTAGATAAAALSLLGGIAVAAQKPVNLQLTAGARVAVVNLLDAEMSVNAMLMEALRERLTQMGLVPVAAAATEALRRAREACFLDAALAKGLPKACGPLFAQLAAAERADAVIVLGPGRNDSPHGARRRELPEYLRGWCLVTEARGEEDAADKVPVLLNLSELLLIGVAAPSAAINAREWGGDQVQTWTGFKPPPDLKDIPQQQLQQASGVLAHLQVTR